MTIPKEFHAFISLPSEIQLIIWKFAFTLISTSHTPILVTTATSLFKAVALKHNYIRRFTFASNRESSTRPRLASVPRNWLIHDKYIYSCHGNREWKIYLRGNACVEGECWSVKHVRMEAGKTVCLGSRVRAGESEDEIEGHVESEADEQGYRIVMGKKEGLVGLLHACRLSRLAALEEMRKAEWKHCYEAVEHTPHEEGGLGECESADSWKKRREGKTEMVLRVVGKMLNELRSSAAA